MHSSILLFGVLALAVVQQVTALPAPHQDGERSTVKRSEDEDEGGIDRNIFAGLANFPISDGIDGPLSLINTGSQGDSD